MAGLSCFFLEFLCRIFFRLWLRLPSLPFSFLGIFLVFLVFLFAFLFLAAETKTNQPKIHSTKNAPDSRQHKAENCPSFWAASQKDKHPRQQLVTNIGPSCPFLVVDLASRLNRSCCCFHPLPGKKSPALPLLCLLRHPPQAWGTACLPEKGKRRIGCGSRSGLNKISRLNTFHFWMKPDFR